MNIRKSKGTGGKTRLKKAALSAIRGERRKNTMINNSEMTIKLKRKEVCDLLVACTILRHGAEKWNALYSKLQAQLHEFDSENQPSEKEGEVRSFEDKVQRDAYNLAIVDVMRIINNLGYIAIKEDRSHDFNIFQEAFKIIDAMFIE